MTEATSRAEAKARGLAWYVTGKACKRGGFARRKTANGDCQCAECLAAFKAHSNAWAKANPEQHRLGASRRNAKWGANNKHQKAATLRRWREVKPELSRAHVAKRRALRVTASPGWGELDQLAAVEAYELATRREAATGFPWHVDHMIPLMARAACGLHVGRNLQVIPRWLNLRKSNKLALTIPGEWIAHACG